MIELVGNITELLGASAIFDRIFGGTENFNTLPAVNGIRSISLGLSYALFILGLYRLFGAQPKEVGQKLMIFVIALVALSAFPKMATNVYRMAGTVQQKTGVNPSTIGMGMHRIIHEYRRKAMNQGESKGFFNVSGKVGDALLALVTTLILAVLKGFAYIVMLFLQIGYLIRDVAFAFALLLVPFALGLAISPFGREKGISMLFGAIGVALWPMGWLLVDVLVQLILSPLHRTLSPPAGMNEGFMRIVPVGAGLAVITILAMYLGTVTIIIMVGYVKAAIFIQRIMSGISQMTINFGDSGGGRISQQIANVATGGKAGAAQKAAGGATGGAGNALGGAARTRFGGRRGGGGRPRASATRGNRPSFA